MQPVQPLSLIQSPVQKSQAHTEISEPEPARLRFCIDLSWNSKMDAHHHQWCEKRSRPEDPTPREMIDVPPLQQSRNITHEDDVRRIRRNPEDDQPLRKIG